MAICPGQVSLGSLCLYAGEKPLKDVTLRISDLLADADKDAAGSDFDLLHLKLPASWKFRPDPRDMGKAAGWFRPAIRCLASRHGSRVNPCACWLVGGHEAGACC